MNKNTEQLIKELEETKKLLNSFLARRVYKYNSRSSFGRKEFLESRRIDKKLYQLFLDRIDPSDKERLLRIDEELKSIEDEIYKKSGWYRVQSMDNQFRHETNFQNQHDPEFASHDTYRVERTAQGYTYDKKEPFNSYFAGIQLGQKRFYERFQTELERVHELLTEKETIMYGGYRMKDENDKDLLKYISIYLGYKNKPEELNVEKGKSL